MPRVNNANAKDANGSNVNVLAATNNNKVRKRAIKTEVESPGEQNVFHRKSERRRVARDIFLVFEEQPSCRRGRGGGANKKKAVQKPKFGHLMVEDPCRTTKGLLRDIKNEPKCYLLDECTTNAPVITASASPPAPQAPPAPSVPPVPLGQPPTVVTKKEKKNNKNNTRKANNNRNESKSIVVTPKFPKLQKLQKLSKLSKLPDPQHTINESTNDDPVVARVNPIFLWVKQDDTRIVEVRCEDYDKRNRIRLTKTTNGWRAIPRTDPTSSKIVKLLQTPLLKVKREIYENNLLQQKFNEDFSGVDPGPYVSRQIVADVNEKQSLVVENKLENVLASNGNGGEADNAEAVVVSKELDKNENNNNSMKVNNKNKKAKTKKEGKKRGRKPTKVSIPKVEVKHKEEPLQETTGEQNDDLLDHTLHMQSNEIEECRAPNEQMIQSNLETIQHFSELCINERTSTIQLDTASVNLNDDAIESPQSKVKQHAIEGKETEITTSSTTAAPTAFDLELEAPTVVNNTNDENQNEIQIDNTATETETKTYQHHTPHLQLCPITGLFLPNITSCESDNDEGATTTTTTKDSVAVRDDCVISNFNTNFLPKDILVDLVNCDDEDEDVLPNNVENGCRGKLQTINGHYASTNIDADTKNLKDLLDEADLMQHCNDNANSDADIIDSIVKRSCENNLIQETETTITTSTTHKEAVAPPATITFNTTHIIDDATTQKGLMTTDGLLPQHLLDEAVRDSPKCLSFNEAGEIEGLNCELFQTTNHFMDTYEKDSSVEEVCLSDDGGANGGVGCGKKIESADITALSSPLPLSELEDKLSNDVIMEETPKDLSYKKREEVCPPSESRSQCAVTSSSDIVKSPNQQQQGGGGELPAIETTSEAIKNLILEQFIKLNAFNAIPNNNNPAVSKPQQQQQVEPINLGKPQQRDLTRTPSPNDCNDYATSTQSTNYIETVVIDDNSDEEPMKKRIRPTLNKINSKANLLEESIKTTHATSKQAPPTLIDKDPDPLTQLQLLIRNTQWKVPDPILVPKDRLRAVLASPAREIPLLITTRPELRLPEAFAYPEIIQNPNILVISMAQLEAILKNEMEMEKSKQQQNGALALNSMQHEIPIENAKSKSNVLAACANINTNNKQPQHIEPKSIKIKETPPPPPLPSPLNPPAADQPPKCSHGETNLASDINAATLAVLNQMLWLPYFGQLSQEFLKTLNKPLGVQNKYTTASLLPPPPQLYNHHLGLQHLDEMYKNYLKQMTALKHLSAEASAVNNAGMPNFPLPLVGAFQPAMETAVFQKMLQHQLANFINPLATATTTPMQSGILGGGKSHHEASHGAVASNVEHMIKVDEKKSKSHMATTSNTTPEMNAGGSSAGDGTVAAAEVAEKSLRHHNNHNLNNNNNNNNLHNQNNNSNNHTMSLSSDNAAAITTTENVNFNKYAYTQKQEIDNKPRLTCKSLSNLLEPESVPSSPAIPLPVPLVHLTTDHHTRNTAHHHHHHHHHELANTSLANSQMNAIINKDTTNIIPAPAAIAAGVDVMPFKNAKLNKISNAGLNSSHDLVVAAAAKQRKRSMNYADTATASSPALSVAAAAVGLDPHTTSRNAMAENINVEPNQALWHPLFGSNPKTGYSSPWQWTTVTATGE